MGLAVDVKPLSIWAAVAYVIVGTTFLTYLSNSYALSRVPASTVGIYVYLQPLIAAVIALSLGQETLTGVKAVAGALIFAGVWLVSRKGQRSRVKVQETGEMREG